MSKQTQGPVILAHFEDLKEPIPSIDDFNAAVDAPFDTAIYAWTKRDNVHEVIKFIVQLNFKISSTLRWNSHRNKDADKWLLIGKRGEFRPQKPNQKFETIIEAIKKHRPGASSGALQIFIKYWLPNYRIAKVTHHPGGTFSAQLIG